MEHLALETRHRHARPVDEPGDGGRHSAEPPDHGHLHGVADSAYVSTARGLWALKWSFAILGIGALLQLAVVMLSGSVALLADMIHNLADASSAVPLAIAFVAARRPPSERFTYGYGRLEDLAGVAIVAIVLMSAIVAGYEAAHRLIIPRPVTMLGAVAAAGVIGFLANEAVALLRIGVGGEIHSAALIADGRHARADGLASLAVVGSAVAVKAGYPIADSIIGLSIAVMIGAIVWQSAVVVFTRVLDGVEPGIVGKMRHAAGHVPGVVEVIDLRARWLGHRIEADAEIAVDSALSLGEALAVTNRFKQAVLAHLPAPARLCVAIAQKEQPDHE
jgi:cation diffusion facilitator family transporter